MTGVFGKSGLREVQGVNADRPSDSAAVETACAPAKSLSEVQEPLDTQSVQPRETIASCAVGTHQADEPRGGTLATRRKAGLMEMLTQTKMGNGRKKWVRTEENKNGGGVGASVIVNNNNTIF